MAVLRRLIALFNPATNLVEINVGDLGRLAFRGLGGVAPALDKAPSGRHVCDLHGDPRLGRRHALGTSGQQSQGGWQYKI